MESDVLGRRRNENRLNGRKEEERRRGGSVLKGRETGNCEGAK